MLLTLPNGSLLPTKIFKTKCIENKKSTTKNALRIKRKKNVSSMKKLYHKGPEKKIQGAKKRYYRDSESRTQYQKRKYQENPEQKKEYEKKI